MSEGYIESLSKIEQLKEIIETDEQAIKDLESRIQKNEEAIDYLEENIDINKQYLNFGPIFLKFKNDKAQLLLNQEKREMNKFLKELQSNMKSNASKLTSLKNNVPKVIYK
ncbi:hypothetical protein K502DRAFT_351815 [Neoconidiobolus thromboides FSU 785]|nr:hypothetical protein K502DRAFT_351815 [Neoconidiobolus thromboides FSU 785]